MNFDYAGLAVALGPEAALVLGALLVLALDLIAFRRQPAGARLGAASAVAAAALILAAGLALRGGTPGPVFGGVLMLDSLALATRLGVLGLTLLVLGVGTGARPPRQPAEFVAIVLFATAGFTLMGAAQQLLLMFIALKTASLSLYILAGFESWRAQSAEASLKYFLFGSISAAFLLFGLSLIYGLTGSIELLPISAAIATTGFSSALAVALIMILVAFGFKVAAAPFHFWAPDVYQGAPTLSAALIASGSKLAAFTFFLRLLWTGLGPAAGSAAAWQHNQGWLPIVAIMAAAALLLGNLAALAQTNLRRLLAYSAIAHAGALLLGVMATGAYGAAPVYFYAATYGLAVAGAFGVVAAIERTSPCQEITDLAGLRRRSPLLTICLLVFILSLAGIPPLAGFLGKFMVFAAALKLGGVAGPAGCLVILAIFLSAVALFYYLIILKQALVEPAPPEAAPIPVSPVAALSLVAAALLIVALGIFPSILLSLF